MRNDSGREFGATDRSVTTQERDGHPARAVRLSRLYDTTVEDLWDAITDPGRLVRWFLPVSGDLRVGGRYQLEGNAGGEITRCDRPSRLALTWEMEDQVSWVDVRLEPEGQATRLILEHTAPTPDPRWEEFGPGAVGVGWDLCLPGLGRHLTGSGPGPQADPAWVASDEGREFVTASSAAWCRASIAAGTSRTAAEAAGRRVTAFYTGDPSTPG